MRVCVRGGCVRQVEKGVGREESQPLAPKESMGVYGQRPTERGSVLESQTYTGRGGGRVKPLYTTTARRRMVKTNALEGNRRTRVAKNNNNNKNVLQFKKGK